MKIISSLFVSSLFFCHQASACQQSGMTYDEMTTTAEAVYVGGVMGVSIPDLSQDTMKVDLHYPNEMQRKDRIISMKVFQTLHGAQQDELDVTLNFCNAQDAKLGEVAILYKFKDGWYLKHDEFAISETTAMLSTRTSSKIQSLALN